MTNARSKIEEQRKLWMIDKSCPVEDNIIDKAWSNKVHGKLSYEMWLRLLKDN